MTNKPTVQAYLHTGTEDAGQRGVSLNYGPSCTNIYMKTEPLILLSDYEAGLGRDVARMAVAVARINGLERLLRNCRLELKDWMRSHGQDIETKEIIMAIDAALANQEQKP